MSPKSDKRGWFWAIAAIAVVAVVALFPMIREGLKPTISPEKPAPDSSTVPHYIIHLNDHLGSTTLVTDQNANVVEQISYPPFGETLIPHPNPLPFHRLWRGPAEGGGGERAKGEGTTPYQYTGQEWDPSELYNYGARSYDPATSRFLSVDPIDQYSNPYAYAGNNPISRIDPNGLLFEHIFDGPRWHNAERAVTADEFVEYARGRSLKGLLHDIDKGSKRSMSASGPKKEFRFVEDPADITSIIDMRHFLVIGLQGEWIGLAVELSQIIGDPESAFDPQDFYSNALGVEFFSDFYDPEGEPLWRQLNEFFDERRSRFSGNLQSIRRDPGGGPYSEQLEEMLEHFEPPEVENQN